MNVCALREDLLFGSDQEATFSLQCCLDDKSQVLMVDRSRVRMINYATSVV